MKASILLILLALCHLNCKAQGDFKGVQQGIYKQKGSSIKLELKSNGTYILYNPQENGHLAIEKCIYSSIGKWRGISDNTLEITSENYYQKQDGFTYDLKKQNKPSKDSLYIVVNLPDSLIYYKNGIPLSFSFTFNNDISKSIVTNKGLIKLAKQKYLWAKTSNSVNTNHIAFSVNANISGTTLYKSRIMFEIFEEDIDTEKTNLLTITLPHFDLCFFEFEPYKQELIFVKSHKELIWQGESWEKQP